MRIRMALGGRAWRGYFPVGAELTSGKPDQKEGLYFGAELDDDAPRGAGVDSAPRPQSVSAAPARATVGRPRSPRRDDAARPPLDGRHRARARARARLLRRSLHRRSAGPVSHLPLPAAAGRRRSGHAVERRRAHRLRAPHHPDAGRDRRAGGEVEGRLDRSAAGRRLVRLQHRRHARPDDRRPLPLDAAPRAQPQRPRPPLVPLLLRSGMERQDRADPDRRRSSRRPRPALGPLERPRVQRHLRRLSAAQGRPRLPRPRRRVL